MTINRNETNSISVSISRENLSYEESEGKIPMINSKVDGFLYTDLPYRRPLFSFTQATSGFKIFVRLRFIAFAKISTDFSLVIARLPPAPSNVTNEDQKKNIEKKSVEYIWEIYVMKKIVAHYILLLDVE